MSNIGDLAWVADLIDKGYTIQDALRFVGTRTIYGLDYDLDDPTAVFVDPNHHCMAVIDAEHSKIHQSKLYTVAARAVVANGGGTHEFLGVTNSSAYVHFRKVIISSDGGPFNTRRFP